MSDRSRINARNPHARAGQSAGAAAAQAAAADYAAAAPGTAVTLPSYITPERAAIIAGTAPPPTSAPGPTIIKPQPGQPSQPPAPAPVFDDPDPSADAAPTNPYLSLLDTTSPAATLADNTSSSGTATSFSPVDFLKSIFGDAYKGGFGGGSIFGVPVLLIILAAPLLLWALWRKFR